MICASLSLQITLSSISSIAPIYRNETHFHRGLRNKYGMSYKAKQLGFLSICWTGGQRQSLQCSRRKPKPAILQSYQFGSGQCQSKRGSPPATTGKPTAHLLHRHIRQRRPPQRAHKHCHLNARTSSSTSKATPSQTEARKLAEAARNHGASM